MTKLHVPRAGEQEIPKSTFRSYLILWTFILQILAFHVNKDLRIHFCPKVIVAYATGRNDTEVYRSYFIHSVNQMKEYTSSVAPRHTQRITSQAHKTQNQCLPHRIWIESFLQWVPNRAQTVIPSNKIIKFM